MGGAALDATGVPLPDDTLSAAKQSHAVLLGAVGGYKWDKNEKHLKPETGLLQIRKELGVFANLRPATVYSPVKIFSSYCIFSFNTVKVKDKHILEQLIG